MYKDSFSSSSSSSSSYFTFSLSLSLAVSRCLLYISAHNPSMTMDPSSVLKDLSKRATRFSVNLDGQVKLDKQINSHGHSALVYHGILCQNGIKTNVAVKVFRTGAPGEDTLKVISLTWQQSFLVSTPFPAYPPRGTLMVQVVSRKYCSYARNFNGFRIYHFNNIRLDAQWRCV